MIPAHAKTAIRAAVVRNRLVGSLEAGVREITFDPDTDPTDEALIATFCSVLGGRVCDRHKAPDGFNVVRLKIYRS